MANCIAELDKGRGITRRVGKSGPHSGAVTRGPDLAGFQEINSVDCLYPINIGASHFFLHCMSRMFATLDPTTRRLKLPTNQNVLLTDTVGFIRKLPHRLVKRSKQHSKRSSRPICSCTSSISAIRMRTSKSRP